MKRLGLCGAMLLVWSAGCGDGRSGDSDGGGGDGAVGSIDASIDPARCRTFPAASGATTLSLSPTTLDFGAVLEGTTLTRTLTVRNSGSAPTGLLRRRLTAPNGEFVVIADSCSATWLAPGASCGVDVRYDGPDPGRAGALEFGDGATSAMAQLVAETMSPARLAAVLFGVSDEPIHFPATAVGGATMLRVSIRNDPAFFRNSNQASGAVTSALSGPQVTEFTLIADTCAGRALDDATTCFFDVRFSPASAGLRMATLTVSANPGGPLALDLLGLGSAPPGTPAELATSLMRVDSSGSHQITIWNTGQQSSGALTAALGGADAAEFSLTLNQCQSVDLAGGATCRVEIAGNPAGGVLRNVTLTVRSASVSIVRALSIAPAPARPGPALATDTPRTPVGYDFGVVPLGGASCPVTFEVENLGARETRPLNVLMVSRQRIEDSFIRVADTCSGHSLAPGATCAVSVRFAPVQLGDDVGNLVVFAPDANPPAQQNTLKAAGVDATAPFVLGAGPLP